MKVSQESIGPDNKVGDLINVPTQKDVYPPEISSIKKEAADWQPQKRGCRLAAPFE